VVRWDLERQRLDGLVVVRQQLVGILMVRQQLVRQQLVGILVVRQQLVRQQLVDRKLELAQPGSKRTVAVRGSAGMTRR
jgi:hypothetical protein